MANRTLTDTATITQDVATGGQLKLNIPTTAPIAAASLALGGATIGSNALAVTGVVNFNSKVNITTAGIVMVDNISGGVVFGTTSSATQGMGIGAGTGGFVNASNAYFAFAATTTFNISGLNPDTLIYRDAAGILAQVNGTNAQTLRVYNTSSSSNANYERGVFDWGTTSNVLTIGTQNAGTGTARNLQFVVGGVVKGDFGLTNSNVWTFSGTTVYVGGINAISGDFTAPATRYMQWANRTEMSSPADGQLLLQNWAATDFGRILLGGTTSSFPALKRSTASIEFKLADDSAYTNATAATFTNNGVAFASLPGSPVAGMTAYITDCNTSTWGANAAGGGSTKILVWYNGTNWTVAGK